MIAFRSKLPKTLPFFLGGRTQPVTCTSNFSLTSVIDNVHMLMCMNDKFSLTSTAFTSPICWCEGINKFSLTSFHSSQQYNYTADYKIKTKNGAPFSFFDHGSCNNKTAVRPQIS